MAAIDIISVGPGEEGMMTRDAQDALIRSEIVFAAKRHAHLAPNPCTVLPLEPLNQALDAIDAQTREGRHITILLSGDAGVYSLLPVIVQEINPKNLRVYPGISALQALCAEAKETWQDAKIISVHGRPLHASSLGYIARTHARTILFCDAECDAKRIAGALVQEGLSEIEMIVGERLSYADQQVYRGKACEFAAMRIDPLCMVMLKNPSPSKGRLPRVGLNDGDFVRGKTPMTKREIRVQILAQLQLDPDSIVWDIGAGTGSVSIECARQCPFGTVYAIERKAEALQLIHKNMEAFRASNVRLVKGNAPKCLPELPVPTHIFIGGSGGSMNEIFDAIEKIPRLIRLVGTAVTLEGEQRLLTRMSRYRDFAMSQIAVSRVEVIGRYHMMRGQNPVRIASGMWEGTE